MKFMPQVTKDDVKHYAVKGAKCVGLALAADVALLGMMVGMGRLEQKFSGPAAVNDAKTSLTDETALTVRISYSRVANSNNCQWHHGQFMGFFVTKYDSPAEPCNTRALEKFGSNL